jgi:hypothetical protein
MPAPNIPYSAKSTLTFPPDDEKTAVERSAAYSGNFTQRVEHKLSLVGAGTHVVGFGTIAAPGVRAILLEYNNDDPQGSLAPLAVTVNGGVTAMEVAPGGHFSFSSPTPTAGITSMSIGHTAAARVNIWMLG